MGCNSCSTDGGTPKGCKSNGSCGTGSCDKLTVFDWLSNMELPTGQKRFNIVEVRFKNGRKHFYRNEKNLQLCIGDVIAVEGNPGHDVGTVSLTGELVKIQMKKKKVAQDSDQVKKIYRKANPKDIETWQAARDKELATQTRGREIILKLGLKMKLSDVEYQGDGNKATFYYTADERVDFRQLIRDLASAFNIRIEMKQVGLRQEASRLGGVGSCGRELCCSTWLTDFRKVNTAAARYQQLSLNPQKLAGQCGKLKCCLNYELDTYLDALKAFPKSDVVLKTEKGVAEFIKMDIFKELFWYAYKEEKFKWFKLTLEQVNEIIAENKAGNLVESLEDFDAENQEDTKIEFENVVGQDSLTRFDAPKKPKRRRNNRKRTQSHGKKESGGNTQQKQNQTKERPEAKKTQGQKPNRNRPQRNQQQQGGEENKTKQRPQNRNKRRPNNRPKKEDGVKNTSNNNPQQQKKTEGVKKEGNQNKGRRPRPQNSRRRPNNKKSSDTQNKPNND